MATVQANAAGANVPVRWVHIALWVLQVGLAGLFVLAGQAKLFLPEAELNVQMPYTLDVPLALMRFIGVAELAGAVGVVLPAATRIQPWLTPLAALGMATIMVLATLFHVSRGEFFALPVTLGLGVAALLVAWGRYRKAPIAPRG